jgi:hypothetical protein
MSGELVVYRAKLHWIIFSWAAVWFLLAVLIFIGRFLGRASEGGEGFLFVGVLLALLAYLKFASAEFAVTNRRVIVKVGVVRRRSLETLLDKIEGVSVDQGVIGRLLGYGTITVNGTGSTRSPFSRIASPLEFRRHVQEQIESSTRRPAAMS